MLLKVLTVTTRTTSSAPGWAAMTLPKRQCNDGTFSFLAAPRCLFEYFRRAESIFLELEVHEGTFYAISARNVIVLFE